MKPQEIEPLLETNKGYHRINSEATVEPYGLCTRQNDLKSDSRSELLVGEGSDPSDDRNSIVECAQSATRVRPMTEPPKLIFSPYLQNPYLSIRLEPEIRRLHKHTPVRWGRRFEENCPKICRPGKKRF